MVSQIFQAKQKLYLAFPLLFLGQLLFTPFFGYGGEIQRINEHNSSLIPKGKEIDAMIGDWIIRNDKVVAVIGDVHEQRHANQMVFNVQGAVLDFTFVDNQNDQLTSYYPMGVFPFTPAADIVEIVKPTGKTVEIKFIRRPTEKSSMEVVTTYTLNDGETFLRIKTMYKNMGSKEETVRISDKLRGDNDLDSYYPEGKYPYLVVDNPWLNATYGLITANTSELYTSGKITKRPMPEIGLWIEYLPYLNQDSISTITLKVGRVQA